MASTFTGMTLHWARRTCYFLRTEGAGPVFRRAVARLRMMSGFLTREQRDFLARKTSVDADFDGVMGTDTGGIQALPSLTVKSPNARYGIDHIASDPGEFARALAAIDIPFASTTFLDLGAGKGRALLLAARHPFHRIIGIEFAQELYATAVHNLALAGGDPRISIVHGDATEVVFPDGPLVIFMYNPFDGPIVHDVALRALASFRAELRPMRILYLNPRFPDDVTRAGWNIVVNGDGYTLFAPA